MKGRIHIFNSLKKLGRILLTDSRESAIIHFPACMEDRDLADCRFQGDDPTKPLASLTAISADWHYGFIIVPPDSGKYCGSILVTYPRPRGLLRFSESMLPEHEQRDSHGLKLKFKIQKTLDGREQAKSIRLINPRDGNESIRCNKPRFGLLDIVNTHIEVGIVQAIMDQKPGYASGRVTAVISRDNAAGVSVPVFGFISCYGTSTVAYFTVNKFKKYYGKLPHKDHKVCFKTQTQNGKLGVQAFCEQSDFDNVPIERAGFLSPINDRKQRIYFEETVFFDTYGKKPEAGDTVFYTLENSEQLHFFREDSRSHVRLQLIGRHSSDRTSTHAASGAISSGFEEGYSPTDSPLMPIDPSALYCVYSGNSGEINEYRIFDPRVLSEAISCYKDRYLLQVHKLDAIEALIRYHYEDNYIYQEQLREERLNVLEQRVEQNIENGDTRAALTWEARLQALRYDPSRLKKHAVASPYRLVMDTQVSARPIEPNSQMNPWALALAPAEENIFKFKNTNSWALIIQEERVHETKAGETFWSLIMENNEEPEVPMNIIEQQFALIPIPSQQEEPVNG